MNNTVTCPVCEGVGLVEGEMNEWDYCDTCLAAGVVAACRLHPEEPYCHSRECEERRDRANAYTREQVAGILYRIAAGPSTPPPPAELTHPEVPKPANQPRPSPGDPYNLLVEQWDIEAAYRWLPGKHQRLLADCIIHEVPPGVLARRYGLRSAEHATQQVRTLLQRVADIANRKEYQ